MGGTTHQSPFFRVAKRRTDVPRKRLGGFAPLGRARVRAHVHVFCGESLPDLKLRHILQRLSSHAHRALEQVELQPVPLENGR